MKTKKKQRFLSLVILVPMILAAVYLLAPRLVPTEWFSFAYQIPEDETALRQRVVDTACGWAGIREDDGSHRSVIDLYNTLDPLPRRYPVTYEDAWCAAFVSAAALEAELTDIIPPECSCIRQIGLFQELGRWEEDDGYCPLPGDIIYYDWDFSWCDDCTGPSDHVGIVVGTYGPFIQVMEGNKDDDASYRVIWKNDWCIRGYGLPDYQSKCK